MAKTPMDSSIWSDADAAADDGEGVLILRLLARIKSLETKVATLQAQSDADHASLITIQTRLGLINAILHLW